MKPAVHSYLEEVVRTIERRFIRRANAASRYPAGIPRKQLWELKILNRAKQLLEAENARRARGKQLKLPFVDCPGQTFIAGTEPEAPQPAEVQTTIPGTDPEPPQPAEVQTSFIADTEQVVNIIATEQQLSPQ